MLPTKFQVILPFGSREEAKNRFSRWPPWQPSWIPDRNDLIYFGSISHPDAAYQFQVNWPFGSGEKAKIDFQDGRNSGHLGFQIGMILAIFDLQVTQMLPTKFQVSLPFGSREEAKNRFSRWPPWQPSWIPDRNDLIYFGSISHPDAAYQFQVN